MYTQFEDTNTIVIAVAQEDKDLESHGRFLQHFGERGPRFEIVADLERKGTDRYKRTNTYFIDTDGIVRQIFPQMIHHRADWSSILGEVKRLTKTPE